MAPHSDACLCLDRREVPTRRTWNTARRYQLICAHHYVQLLPTGRPWTHSAEVPVVEEVYNNSADGAVCDSVPSLVPAADIRVQLPQIHRVSTTNQRIILPVPVWRLLQEDVPLKERRLKPVHFSACVCVCVFFCV